MGRRVMITGIGVISAIGKNWDEFSHNLLSGKSGANQVSLFDASTLPTRVAAEVKDFDLFDYVNASDAHRYREWCDRKTELGIAACVAAIEDSGYQIGQVDCDRIALSFGTSLSYPSLSEIKDEILPYTTNENGFDYNAYAQKITKKKTKYLKRYLFDQVSCWLGYRVKAKGGIKTHFSACAASTQRAWTTRGRC